MRPTRVQFRELLRLRSGKWQGALPSFSPQIVSSDRSSLRFQVTLGWCHPIEKIYPFTCQLWQELFTVSSFYRLHSIGIKLNLRWVLNPVLSLSLLDRNRTQCNNYHIWQSIFTHVPRRPYPPPHIMMELKERIAAGLWTSWWSCSPAQEQTQGYEFDTKYLLNMKHGKNLGARTVQHCSCWPCSQC